MTAKRITTSTLATGSKLLDSGPLAALFNPRDKHHERANAFFKIQGAHLRCHTTWEVVSEVMYFLDFSATLQGDLLDWLDAGNRHGLMTIASLAADDLPGLSALMRKYADRPMDLADASLVWLANKTGVTDIITIDRTDFAVYRTAKGKAFRNAFGLTQIRSRIPRRASIGAGLRVWVVVSMDRFWHARAMCSFAPTGTTDRRLKKDGGWRQFFFSCGCS